MLNLNEFFSDKEISSFSSIHCISTTIIMANVENYPVLNMLNLIALQDLQEHAILRDIPRRILNLRQADQFELPDSLFIKLYRLNKQRASDVLDIVTNYIPEPTRRSALDAQTMVMILYKHN